MKEEAIKRINKFGKVGKIVALVSKIFCIVAVTLCVIATIASIAIPKRFINVAVTTSVKVGVDLTDFGIDLSMYKDEIEESIREGHVSVGSIVTVDTPVTGTVNGSKIDIDAGSYTVNANPRNVTGILIVGTLNMIGLLVAVIFIEQLMKALRDCESPFCDDVIKKIRNIGFALIPWAVLSMVDVNPFNEAAWNSLSIDLGVNMGIVVTVLIIFGLAYVFKYGAALQQESDETL